MAPRTRGVLAAPRHHRRHADRGGAVQGRGASRWLIGISVVSWAARTESRKDAGSVNTGSIGATEDTARRRFAAAAPATLPYQHPLAAARPARDIDRPSTTRRVLCRAGGGAREAPRARRGGGRGA